MIYIVAILLLLAGCDPYYSICGDAPGVYTKIQKDKFAYFDGDKPKYVIDTRGYGKCSVTNLNEEIVNKEVWEGK